MDLRDNLSMADSGLPAGAAIDKTASMLKNAAGKVRNKAKAKKAAKIAASGGYATLTPFQKSLIPVPPEIAKAAQAAGVTTDQIKAADPAPATSAQNVSALKKFLPYIIGVIILVIVYFFVIKHK